MQTSLLSFLAIGALGTTEMTIIAVGILVLIIIFAVRTFSK
jgi:hypothetical protein